jgi:hypothetical protein
VNTRYNPNTAMIKNMILFSIDCLTFFGPFSAYGL